MVWNTGKLLLIIACWRLHIPSTIAFFAHILLPLGMIQVHILWVHTVLATNRTNEPFWRRLVPATVAFRAVALPMALELCAETVTRYTLVWAYGAMKLQWESFIPVLPKQSDQSSVTPFYLLMLVLVVVLVLPAQTLLVRVEASLLEAGEDTIVPLDPALAGKHGGLRGYVTLMKAWKSFTKTSSLNLVLLYLRIFFAMFVAVAIVGFVDSAWWLVIALLNWRF
jgi:hypothetical protein